jgi:hypothetical protein
MRPDRALVVISLGLALVAAVVVLGPLGFGRDNLVYVFLPAVFTLIPLASDRLSALLVAAGLMLMFVFLEILTIGVYYLPAAGAMSTAALVAAPSRALVRRRKEVDKDCERVESWAKAHPRVRAVAVVGAWAGTGGSADSDLLLVVVTDDGDQTPLPDLDNAEVTFVQPGVPLHGAVRPIYDPDGLLRWT